MTSIGAGFRLATSRTVPADFAHAHLTDNLALDPSQGPSHTAWFDDAPPEGGRQTVNICVQDPICGVVRLGYMTLDMGPYHEASQGFGDGHVGAGADQAIGARDRQTGTRPEDAYLKQLIEESRNRAPASAGSGDDDSLVPNPRSQTYAEAFQTVRDVMDDSKRPQLLNALLDTSTQTAEQHPPVQPASLMILSPSTSLRWASKRDDDTSSDSAPLPPTDSGNGPRLNGAVTGGLAGLVVGGAVGTLLLPGPGTAIGIGIGEAAMGGSLAGMGLGWWLGGSTHPAGGSQVHTEGTPPASPEDDPEESPSAAASSEDGGASTPHGPYEATPRDGMTGGKPTGVPETPRGESQMRESIKLQNETGEIFADIGYDVGFQPDVLPSDGLAPDVKPDYRMGGNIVDHTAPTSSNVNQVRIRLSDKISEKQAFRLVLDLSRTSVTKEEILALLRRKPISGLRELFIRERNGTISRAFPNPETLRSGP